MYAASQCNERFMTARGGGDFRMLSLSAADSFNGVTGSESAAVLRMLQNDKPGFSSLR